MDTHWLDSDVFISSKNAWYGFDIVPAFWVFLENQAHLGALRSPMEVYRELVEQGDELSSWVKQQQDVVFIEADQDVQQEFSSIVNYVSKSYDTPNSAKFLDGADPWVIAHAKANSGIVVTREAKVGSDSKKVKIPNICEQFGVPYVTLWQMLRSTGASF